MREQPMHLEVEVKFRAGEASDLAAIRSRLWELGARAAGTLDQADTYFAHPARDFAQTDEALRLRRVGERNCITYKGPKLDAATKTRRELELPLAEGGDAFDRFSELLIALGFRPVATVRKQREVLQIEWQSCEIEAALDTVTAVGPFVELETSADEATVATARQAITSLAKQLGLSDSERRSYLELLLEGRT
jgi:adenylate cyclase class 2